MIIAGESLIQETIQTTLKVDHMNSTSANYENRGTIDAIAFVQLTVLFLTLVVGFLGNALVVGVVIFHRQMRTRTNIFLTQLAITGMGVCILHTVHDNSPYQTSLGLWRSAV